MGLSRNIDGIVQVYEYNTEADDFRELRNQRVSHFEKYPTKLMRVGDEFFYTGTKGRVMRVVF